MNVQRFKKLCNCNYFYNAQKFRSVAQAAAENILPKEEAKITQISSGIKVASVEDNGPLTHVSVVIKAGSRYENPKSNLGIVHCLRNASVLTTKNHSNFSLTRNLEIRGAKLCASATRDHLFYTLKCNRDDVDPCLEILSEVANKHVFKPWEVSDSVPNLELDLALLNQNPTAVLNELLHKAAFRGGLSNSLYSPSWMVGKHNPEMLHDYVHENFTAGRTSVVGLGIPLDHLQSRVNELFEMSGHGSDSNMGVSKFFSGEVRQEADMEQTHVAIVAEGSGLNNAKEALSLGVLEALLGSGSDISHSSAKFTKLGAAAAKSTQEPFYVSSLNLKYADTGLFGIHVVGSPDSMGDVVKAVVSEMKQVAKNISEPAVETAKHKLKAKLLRNIEHSDDLLTAMGIEVSEVGQVRNVNDILNAIDSLKASDIQAVAGRVVKAKPAMAALGRLHATPHVDELL